MSELETLGGGFEQGKRSRVRAAFGVLLVIVVSAAVVFVSVGLGKIALTEAGIAPIFRGLMLTSAAFVFGICAWVTWTLVKRKITTGRFTLDPEAARRRREEQMNKLGAGKPLRPQLDYWLLPLGVSAWLLTAAGGIVWEKAAWCDCEPRVVWMVWGLTAAVAALGLIYPAMCVWRKATTGHFLASNERIRARLSRVGKPVQKWQQGSLAALWTTMALAKTFMTLSRPHPRASGWFVAGAFWFAAVMWALTLVLKKPGHGAGNRSAGPGDSRGAGDGTTEGLGSRV